MNPSEEPTSYRDFPPDDLDQPIDRIVRGVVAVALAIVALVVWLW